MQPPWEKEEWQEGPSGSPPSPQRSRWLEIPPRPGAEAAAVPASRAFEVKRYDFVVQFCWQPEDSTRATRSGSQAPGSRSGSRGGEGSSRSRGERHGRTGSVMLHQVA